MSFQAFAQLPQSAVGHDVVTIENRSGLVATDFHRFFLAETRLDHVRQRGAPQIVKEGVMDPSHGASRRPRLLPVRYAPAVVLNQKRTAVSASEMAIDSSAFMSP